MFKELRKKLNSNYKIKELSSNYKRYGTKYTYISLEKMQEIYNVIENKAAEVIDRKIFRKYTEIHGIELKTLLPEYKKVLGIEFCISNTRYFYLIPLDEDFKKAIFYKEEQLLINQENLEFITFEECIKKIREYLREIEGFGYFDKYEKTEKYYLDSLKKYDEFRIYNRMNMLNESISRIIDSDISIEKIELDNINDEKKISNIYYLKSLIYKGKENIYNIDYSDSINECKENAIKSGCKNINLLKNIIEEIDIPKLLLDLINKQDIGVENLFKEVDKLNICIKNLEMEQIEETFQKLVNTEIIGIIEKVIRIKQNKDLNIALIKLYENLLAKVNANDIYLIKILLILYKNVEEYIYSGYMLFHNQIKKYPETETLYLQEIGYICMLLRKYDEAEAYFRKIEEDYNKVDEKMYEKIKNANKVDIGFACLVQNKLDEAEVLFKEVEKEVPGNTIYHNLGRLYFEKKDYEQAKLYFKKALFISQDETSYGAYANTLYFNEDYKEAIEYYKKSIAFIENEDAVFSYNENGVGSEKMFSYPLDDPNKTAKKDAYENIIYSYMELEDYISAKTYHKVATEEFKNEKVFEKMERTLNKLISYDENASEMKNRYEEVCKDLEKERSLAREQCGRMKEWALELIKLQDENIDIELTDEELAEFDKHIEKIIQMMKDEKSTAKNNDLFYKIEKEFKENYPNISDKSLKFLTTGEYLYRVNEDEFIDYAPIMIEYCKVIELELNEYLMKKGILKKRKMLGQMNRIIKDLNIVKISRFLDDIVLNRNASAHTGRINREDVEHVRNIIIDEGFLKLIISD